MKLVLVLLVLALLLTPLASSCGPSATTSSPTTTATTTTTTTTAPTTVTTTTAPTTATTTTTTKPTVPSSTAAPTSTLPTKPTTTGTTTAKWWDKFGKPQYGGTIVFGSQPFAFNLDNSAAFHNVYNMYLETLWLQDWTLDRSIWGFNTAFSPTELFVGLLAKSWEFKDPVTLVVKLNEGIKYQNKPPTNGREFTSADIVFHYNKHLGLGDGYTKGTSFAASVSALVSKVTALDKYTVEFKFKTPGILNWDAMTDISSRNMFESKEQIQMQGGFTDWKNASGTGPWILSGYVADSSVSYVRNPDYWRTDPRYPENKLPYADKFEVLIISDVATRMAAMRTGKVDYLSGVDWPQTQSLIKSNPEVVVSPVTVPTPSIYIMVQKPPWTDLNVRKALDLAIDRASIALYHWGGAAAEPNVCGMTHPVLAKFGYGEYYADWPQSLKDEYAYNPTKAIQLLQQAGIPRGYKTTLQGPTTADTELLQILKSEWADIGIDVDIMLYEPAAWTAIHNARSAQNLGYGSPGQRGSHTTLGPVGNLYKFGSGQNYNNVNDPVYEALNAKYYAATTLEELKGYLKQMDRRANEQHWAIATVPINVFEISYPYLEGLSGELIGGSGNPYYRSFYWSTIWIDQAAKAAAQKN